MGISQGPDFVPAQETKTPGLPGGSGQSMNLRPNFLLLLECVGDRLNCANGTKVV